jgi:hypothetical protein
MTAEDHGWETLRTFDDGTAIIRDPNGAGGMTLGIDDGGGEYTWIDDDNVAEFVATIAAAFDLRVAGTSASGVAGESLNEQLLQVAIDNDVQVRFNYAKGDGAIIEARALTPVKLDEAKGHKIVTGFDPDREDIRAYRLDRIKGTVSV